ncbi:hypothetical protein N7493_001225 [Penicillium malachiteum]|uniref:Uncharacterized protein n=1 Tax=Penicillium malachiteum TaxID=1324776 RepID=A0AAD6HTT9_9EURO|nr:hypothetical protein N7493_001225 [Penicillium malachiteum]
MDGNREKSGTLQLYPSPQVGDDEDHPPGPWADILGRNPWRQHKKKQLKNGTLGPTALHDKLLTSPILREPILRRVMTSAWTNKMSSTGLRFFNAISRLKSRAEAMQIVARGQRLEGDEACEPCKLGHGLFASCVAFKGPSGIWTMCANCHFRPQGKNCNHAHRRLASPPSAIPNMIQSLSPPEPGLFDTSSADQEALELMNDVQRLRGDFITGKLASMTPEAISRTDSVLRSVASFLENLQSSNP